MSGARFGGPWCCVPIDRSGGRRGMCTQHKSRRGLLHLAKELEVLLVPIRETRLIDDVVFCDLECPASWAYDPQVPGGAGCGLSVALR